MKHFTYNILFPLLVPLSFLAIASTPVEVFGCAMRGLIAVLIALIGPIIGIVFAILGMKKSIEEKLWLLLTIFILSVPAFYLVIFEM